MGQLNQQLVNFISTSSLDEATKQQLLQLAQLFLKDPVNFWANNWSTVLSVVSKLPESFLTQIQSLLFPSAGTKVTTLDINNFLNLLSSMGQLNQQLVNFISTSSLDDATKQQLLQLAQLFFKDPVNFWANNWSTVLSVVSKLPQSFLTQIQSLLFPSAGTKVTTLDINNFLNLLSSMGQLNQQLVNFISTSSLDDATKQQLLQLAQLFFKDPVNFWANNWSTVLSVVSKLPQSFLTQIQSLLFPSAGTKVTTLDINNFLNLLSSMGQLNQQLVNFISTSSLDEATKQQLLQLAQLFLKDPVNFWANNWSTVLSVVSKLPQSFLTQIQSLLFPSAGTKVTTLDINNFLNLLSSMGQLNQQLVNFISTSSLDDATKQQLLQLAQLFLKDPVNFWANNWSTVLSVVSKLPQSFLTQIQSLLFPSTQ
jgi:archaellum biogenesis ATPase FlaH